MVTLLLRLLTSLLDFEGEAGRTIHVTSRIIRPTCRLDFNVSRVTFHGECRGDATFAIIDLLDPPKVMPIFIGAPKEREGGGGGRGAG